MQMELENRTLESKLLLVDDRRENLFSLGSLLGELGIQIYKASSGAEALALMVDHDFALAIVDVQMPEMDGFELAELMRGAEKTKSVPIMFITAASESSGFSFRGYESGGVDFLYKPVNPSILKSKVRVFIQLDSQKKLLHSRMLELEEAKEAAEKANQLKSSFLANMSHEIRTPLGALMGFAELLEDPGIPEEEKKSYPSVIRRCGKTLGRLIDDILDLSKVEAGHLVVERYPLSATKLLQEVIEMLAPLASQKGIDLGFEVAAGVPAQIFSDSTRLRQVLMNIIGNAIKFTEKGGVTVSLRGGPGIDGRSEQVLFEVKDTGIGLCDEQLKRLFQPFMQADNSVTRKFGGTGLGLILSRRLATLMGGDVYIKESHIGVGSTFVVSIATGADEQKLSRHQKGEGMKAERAGESLSLDGVRVLLVEDSPDNQALIKIVLAKRGILVDLAHNGLQGVEKATAGDYDVVLMDVQMPVMDGYQATRRLREGKFTKPIIALTAHAMPEERERCLQAGCSDYLSKPIDRVLLLEKIAFHAKVVSN